MAVVTLQQAKDHLRISTPDGHAGDADLALKLAQAEAIILDYLKPAEYVGSEPIVAAAVLLQLGELYAFRGDDAVAPPQTEGYLSPTITNLLRRLRQPTLA